VRLKRYLEMRGADSGPWRRLPAFAAFWVGILYDDDSLAAAWDLVKDWTAEERQKLRDDVPRLGFKAEIRARNVLSLAKAMLAMAERGLARRRHVNDWGHDETWYPRPIAGIGRRASHAAGVAEKFHGPWRGSVEPVFTEYAY
jgi:glutamate--cysteine ligase